MNEVDNIDPYFRYQNDVWYFGILLTSGKILPIECIENVYDDYISVSMRTSDEVDAICDTYNFDRDKCISSFCSRTTAIVRKEHIVMIFEMADT